MATAPFVPSTTAAAATPSLEDKITAAAEKSAAIVATFSPAAGAAIEAGAQVEPIISALIHMFVGLFHHHVKTAGS